MFKGKYGVVLLPDAPTAALAQALGNNIPGNQIDLETNHPPHITLYHTKVAGVPEDDVKKLLQRLSRRLPASVRFTELAPFGGKFAFWDTERTSELMTLHTEALALARYFEPVGEQQADSEALSLSAKEAANVRSYGHPLVGDLWRPHVTVGYVTEGYTKPARPVPHTGTFEQVAFVRVGDYGTIAEVLEQA